MIRALRGGRALLTLLCLAPLALVEPGVARAQDAPGAQASPAAPSPDELVALNFYLGQNDNTSAQAELRRLQVKYPGWSPPKDLRSLSVTAPSQEIDQIYRQIAAAKYDAARATIAATRASFPDWVPPPEMMQLLTTSEAQAALDQALASGDQGRAMDLAYATPGLLRCDRINNAWRIAEAQASAGRKADALATYRAVVAACTVPKDIQATLEKASGVASPAELEAMIAQAEARLPGQKPMLASLRQRLLGETATAAQAAPAPAPAARTSAAASTQAAPATGRAAGKSQSASSANVGSQSAGAPSDWRSCLARTAGSRQTAALYQRGWCAYNLEQSMEAITAFKAALQGRLNAEQRRDAHFGLALAYLKLKLPNEAAQIAAAIDLSHSQRVEVEGQILDQRGVAAYGRKDYAAAIAYFDALEQVRGGIARDLAIIRAYAYLNSGKRAEARRQFEVLNRQLSTRETRRGLAAAISD